jgi:hypothetical protein
LYNEKVAVLGSHREPPTERTNQNNKEILLKKLGLNFFNFFFGLACVLCEKALSEFF